MQLFGGKKKKEISKKNMNLLLSALNDWLNVYF